MSAEPAHRPQLGELLVHKGLVTEAQLQLALEEQERSGAPLGEILVQLGFASKPTMANALAEQHGGPLRTEYGLALGPTPVPATPLASIGNGAPANGDPAPGSQREQDSLRLALEQHQVDQVELATARASIEALRAELAQANGERAQHAARAERLALQLEATQADPAALARSQSEQAELQVALEQHKVALATARAGVETLQTELTRAREEQKLEQKRSDPGQGAGPEPDTAPETEHLLFLPGPKGYTIVVRSGAAPQVGAVVELAAEDGIALLTVMKVGPSPLPGSPGRCAYLA